MKILILCDKCFPCIRTENGLFMQHMRRARWEPVVVTEQIDDSTFSFLKGETPVTYVNFFHSKGKILQKLEWICIFILIIFSIIKTRRWQKPPPVYWKKGICRYPVQFIPNFPLPAAQYIAEKYHLPLVIDLLDIVEQYASNEYIAHNFRTFFLVG